MCTLVNVCYRIMLILAIPRVVPASHVKIYCIIYTKID